MADASDSIVVTDIFNPILSDIAVTFNGTIWNAGTYYTYNEATGEFSTIAGQITVPEATFTQDASTGIVSINPGISVLTITGTI